MPRLVGSWWLYGHVPDRQAVSVSAPSVEVAALAWRQLSASTAWASTTLSAIPCQVRRASSTSARPKENVSRHGAEASASAASLIAARLSHAWLLVCPPDRKAIPG